MRHIGIIKAVSKIGPPNFPEGSSKVLIVNAPMIFSAMWTMVSPLLPKRTRAKVSISSSRWTSTTLLELIDAEQLPDFLGGERSLDDPHVVRTPPPLPPPAPFLSLTSGCIAANFARAHAP